MSDSIPYNFELERQSLDKMGLKRFGLSLSLQYEPICNLMTPKNLFLLEVLLFCLVVPLAAQAPSRTSQPRVFPPEVHTDNSVTFQVFSPASSRVGVTVGTASFPMGRDPDGLWSVTTTPLPPGFHYYFLDLDGLQVNDPNSPAYYGYSKESGGIEIPEPGTDIFEIQDVPHGIIHEVKYRSSVAGGWKELRVYTPAGYDSGKQKYPVLYLQHGGGENRTSWFNQGRAANILDNLIAAGKAVPMIVVCADGQIPGGGGYSWDGMQGFREEMIDNIIPAVERQFRVRKNKDSRALCGLSMGGGQSFFVGLRCPEVFGHVGVFSAGLFSGLGNSSPNLEESIPGIWSDPAGFNRQRKLFFIACGEDDFRYEATTAAVEDLQERGVDVVYRHYPGDHEWQPWRKALRDFASLLFR